MFSISIFVYILFVVIIFILITHISSFAHLFFINKTKELSLIVNKRKMIGMIVIGFFLSNAKCTITTEKYFRSPEVKVIIWQIRPPNLARFSLYCFSYTNNTMKTFYSYYLFFIQYFLRSHGAYDWYPQCVFVLYWIELKFRLLFERYVNSTIKK